MQELTPLQSASLADDVYALTKFMKIEDALAFLDAKYGHVLSISNSDIIKGKTGGPVFIKSQTAFGFTLLGKGKFKGHAFIIFRSTQYLADWLTNANIGVSRSSYGQPVHDGFNMSFRSMKPQLQEFMNSIGKDVSVIHCIGHSLGGALATICGEWIRAASYSSPYVYTFGSPRVGLIGFADICTRYLGSGHIFRAYHRTDIVPCIPIWPFVHTPTRDIDYFLPSPGIIPAAEYHGMDNYIKSVRGKSWKQLGTLKYENKTDNQIINWLKQSTPINFTISSIEWLNKALLFVLEKCAAAGARLLSEMFSNSFTFLDQLAIVLQKGVDLTANVSEWVTYLIRKIMSMLGMKAIVQSSDLTRDFIRGIFEQLMLKIRHYSQRILDEVLVNGRSIS